MNESTLRQGCVVAVWSDDEDTYVVKVGKEQIGDLHQEIRACRRLELSIQREKSISAVETEIGWTFTSRPTRFPL